MVKIASWNVNSVRSRIGNILDWLKLESPDILCLQETKVVDKDFPMVLLFYQNTSLKKHTKEFLIIVMNKLGI